MGIKVTWIDLEDPVSLEKVKQVETLIGVKLSKQYVDLIKNHDGCTPVQDSFKYFDQYRSKDVRSGIGRFIPIKQNEFQNMITVYQEPPEFFPENLVAFAEDGGGDYICFDYRQGKNNLNPPIVYWNHEADVGKDVSFVANNFEEFLGMLEEPEKE